jgi:hypothetical protein
MAGFFVIFVRAPLADKSKSTHCMFYGQNLEECVGWRAHNIVFSRRAIFHIAADIKKITFSKYVGCS